jgi:PASTA domain-containing protein/IPT/TIG domain-containing protein
MKNVWLARALSGMTAVILGLCGASTASAQLVIGQTASAINPPVQCSSESSFDELQLGVASGPVYFVAHSGVITSWSTFAHGGPSQSFTFKVFRKVAPYTYFVVARDTRPLAPNLLNTFSVAIPVQTGDFLGEDFIGGGAESPCVFKTGLSGDSILYQEGDAPQGQNVVFGGSAESGFRLNVSATLLLPPTITGLSPATGSVKGAAVTITGTNFANVTGVAFGGVAAKSFTVSSEGQITAVAPVSKVLTTVPVTVTNSAGTATSTRPFTYEGCKVPRLKGKKLKAAKKKIRKANCKLGKVKKLHGATAKTGKVTKQSPKSGRVLAPDSRVKITLDA